MAIGWFIVPYARNDRPGFLPGRICTMNDYNDAIMGNGGWWAETEILGNRAIVKVRAPIVVLEALNSAPGFKRIPKDRLDDPLSDLPTNIKKALRDEILDQGYTLAELRERFGNDLGDYTLRDLLRFMARRRRKPRYDEATDEIILDGEIQTPRSIESVDAEVSD